MKFYKCPECSNSLNLIDARFIARKGLFMRCNQCRACLRVENNNYAIISVLIVSFVFYLFGKYFDINSFIVFVILLPVSLFIVKRLIKISNCT